jgi:PAS domain-containing protein
VAYFLFHWGVSPTLGSIHGYSVTSFQSDTLHIGLYNTNSTNSTMKTTTHRDDVWEAVREQCARLCLIGAFCAFIVSEVTSVMTQSGSDVATRGYQVIGIILCAFVGLEAAGYSIRRHQQQQRQLYQCVQTAEHLRFARVALNVSDTAMVFTDMQQHIVWLNPAFLRLIGQDENEPHDLLHQTLSDVLRLAHRDAQRLQHCFCHIDSILGHTGNSNDSVTASNSGGNSNAHSNSSNNTPYTSTVCEEDIMALDKILHVKVLRSSDVDHTNTSNAPSYNVDQQQQQQQPSSSDYSFAVALQDVTEERTMEQFLQAAASTSRQSSQRRSNSAAPLVEAATRMGTTARHWILRKQERTDRGRQ